MKKFARKLVVFSLPFVVYAAWVMLVDPFDYFKVSRIVPDEAKQRISYRLNYRLWKMTEFRRQPAAHILLGDSRMDHLDVDYLGQQTQKTWANLAYGGASMAEIIETFYYADSLTELSRVCIGLNFNLFDRHKNNNLTRQVKEYYRNPLLYLCDRMVLKAGFLLLADCLLGAAGEIEKPPMTPEEFWVHQLEVTTREVCRRYEFAREYVTQLRNLVQYCAKKNISVEFIIFPEHEQLIDRYLAFGRQAEYQRFREEIPALARTHDYSARDEIIRNKALFSDPYHTTAEVYLGIIDEVW